MSDAPYSFSRKEGKWKGLEDEEIERLLDKFNILLRYENKSKNTAL